MAQTADTGAALEQSLKDLKLSNEEVNKLEKAFKDPQFLKLFEEYAKEVSDPKVKAETDAYLRQLEEQGRAEEVYGKGVQLVVPTAEMVLKTKVNGGEGTLGQKIFINVCSSDKVDKYSLTDAKDASGRVGKQLQMPLSLGPKRMGVDKRGEPAAVYDFVVHPETIKFVSNNPVAFKTLGEMALEHVERVSGSKLSQAFKRLAMRFKATEGCEEPPVQSIRTGTGGEAVGGRLKPRADAPVVDVPGAKPAPAAAPAGTQAAAEGSGKAAARSTFSFGGNAKAKEAAPQPTDRAQPGYRHPCGGVTPEWQLVHRGEADLAAAWKDAGRGLVLGGSVPRELLLRAVLPGVASAAAVDLDVGERRLALRVPGRYLLDVPLPHAVDEGRGRARFDKARQQLEVTLPVLPPPPPSVPAAAQQGQEQGQEAREQAEGPVEAAEGSGRGEADAADVVRGTDQDSPRAVGVDAGPSGKGQAAPGAHERAAEELAPCQGVLEEAPCSPGAAGEAQLRGGEDPEGLTENERRWREIHRKEQQEREQEQEQQDAGVVLSSGEQADAVACVVAAGEGSSGEGGAAASGKAVGGVVDAARQRPVVEAAPVVMLRPRLRTELAMELD